ncbi:hypothetical protein B0187_01930 [Haemophilus paracuniculus]|uniref:LPS-assembly lipoprotein LptE n=1 Tax=Haemophilus paracuniculus TaxID=734 RepID=A0A1T0AUC5_9PAST|nr:LPS assembly lipoprotein LptE [Haemophilus paracuniculus]OOS00270.1 hypothetical protein B0187_01930 [Haemophilus paracuniculus]
MLKKLSLLLILFLTACGWHFKNGEQLPPELRTLSFESADQYSEMSRILRNQLLLNDVKIVDRQAGVAKLRLVGTSSESRVVSVFKQAREAEKSLALHVQAIVDMPNKGAYPLEVSVYRSFFDDSRAALAKSAEREMIMKDMYQQAAQQLIIKMAGLQKAVSNQ